MIYYVFYFVIFCIIYDNKITKLFIYINKYLLYFFFIKNKNIHKIIYFRIKNFIYNYIYHFKIMKSNPYDLQSVRS